MKKIKEIIPLEYDEWMLIVGALRAKSKNASDGEYSYLAFTITQNLKKNNAERNKAKKENASL